MRNILLDLDDTIADISKSTYDWLLRHGFCPNKSREDFRFDASVYQLPGFTEKTRNAMFSEPEYWLSIPLLPLAKGFCDSLALLGEIHIVTHRDWYPGIKGDTIRWLNANRIACDSVTCVGREDVPMQKKGAAQRLGITFCVEDSPSNCAQLCAVAPCALYLRDLSKSNTSYGFCFNPNVHSCRTYGDVLAFIRDTPGEINDKRTMYGHFNKNWFGNSGLNFKDEYEAQKWSIYNDGALVAIRTVGTPGAPFYPNLDFETVVIKADELRKRGVKMQFSAMMPDEFVTIQGQVQRDECYLTLEYNDTIKGKNMREVMPFFKTARGLTALNILKAKLYPEGYDTIQTLLDQYPDAVIEFASYSVPCGDMNRYELVWEVRTGY